MPLNPRQQRFVTEYLRCGNATEAYRIAYECTNDATAKANGHRLLTNADIATQVCTGRAAITVAVVEGSKVNAVILADALWRNHVAAHAARQFSASNRALELIGKHIDFFGEDREKLLRVEVTDARTVPFRERYAVKDRGNDDPGKPPDPPRPPANGAAAKVPHPGGS